MLTISPFPLMKVSATGNDFLLADLTEPAQQALWQSEFAAVERTELARRWCDRHHGLGADGLVILEPEAGLDFRWDFYNSDGSRAEMCGNATRAVALYYNGKQPKTQIRFGTLTGPVTAQVVSPDDIQVELAAIENFEWGLTASAANQAYDFVSTGNPHAVVRVDSMADRAELRRLTAVIKAESRFQKHGVNVTFVHPITESVIESQTFERGVEDFTLSCGTGAVAAAFSILRGKENQPVEVRVPGGTLFVLWKKGRPTLTRPARIVAEMHLIR
jgi:diaminopimelate epimerase